MHLMRSIPITVISNNWEVIKTAWPAVTTHQIITEKNIINNQLWRFMKISPKGGHNICDCLADRFLMPSCGHLNWNKCPRERSIDPILLKGKHRVADESGWVTQKVCVVVVGGVIHCVRWCIWVEFICVLQVLCSNSVLDSSEYWLRNEKTLCRLGLLDDDMEGGCTMVSSIRVGNKVWPQRL